MPDIREKRVELVLQQLDELPTLPAVAMRVLEITGDEASSARHVVELISTDPSLTACILQLVHRADSGVRGEVNSIDRAVVLLGFDAIRSAVLAISVFQTLGAGGPPSSEGEFNREEFWKHCVAVACCAELLVEHAGLSSQIKPSEAFICGLLHDIGKAALDSVLPKSFRRVVQAADLLRGNIADIERNVIGLDHMVVGKRLAEKWRFPAMIRDSIWLHGQDPRALPANVKDHRLVNLITLADQIVREHHFGYSGNFSFPLSRESLAQTVGVNVKDIDAVLIKLPDCIQRRAMALGLGRSSSAELLQGALAQANKELGVVSTQLAAKNRKLSAKAHCFDALSTLHVDSSTQRPAQGILEIISRSAVNLLGVPCAAAFSIPPGSEYAQIVFYDGEKDKFHPSLIDASPVNPTVNDRASDQSIALVSPSGPAGLGPVLPAGEDLEWIIATVSPRLPNDRRFWIQLEAEGQCVGGVFWGAAAGEIQRLSTQSQELTVLANAWALALRIAQVREDSSTLAEQLAEANRRLQNAQNEILRGRSLKTVAEMAAGAAHEMNNPLAVISGRSQLLASQLSEPKQKAAAMLVFEQSHRLSEIISDLMTFAKPDRPVIERLDISELINNAVRDAKARHNPTDRNIEVTIEVVPPIDADPRQVSDAIGEVIDNAFVAAEGPRGRVTISAAHDPCTSSVVITVSDTGCGMDENTLKRAFDPFFSGKIAGRRRGMGLAKALRWIEASGGSMRLESRAGQGTRCAILLPAAASATEGVGIRPLSEVARRKAS